MTTHCINHKQCLQFCTNYIFNYNLANNFNPCIHLLVFVILKSPLVSGLYVLNLSWECSFAIIQP